MIHTSTRGKKDSKQQTLTKHSQHQQPVSQLASRKQAGRQVQGNLNQSKTNYRKINNNKIRKTFMVVDGKTKLYMYICIYSYYMYK